MALKIELLDANGNPTGKFLSQGDMSLPLESTHYMDLGDGSDTVYVQIRIVNDAPTAYKYRNVEISTVDTNPTTVDSYGWINYQLPGTTSWSYAATISNEITDTYGPIQVRIKPSNNAPAGTYTGLKIQLTYDEIDLSQLPS
ncbi:hypothetical protein MTAT_04560 [Moorella thermoacetica]|uniref:Uncharacterized protein n=1 Tax=Neomoorella thermoacetica TaxID=1525 RepID=A0AAC9HIX3_NEOTH|nr:hypothetical protein [Moorella thermoacetica]AOQ24745.1 hypothetical protein Maut_02317 [Moorella thermoacetica]TYL15717.1 hypothetical protein MTAT_04560 [Moorella thermoacetica]